MKQPLGLCSLTAETPLKTRKTPETVVSGGAAGRTMRRCVSVTTQSACSCQGICTLRGAIYCDGFNMYHAVDDLHQPYLKWCNLHRLGSLIARGHAKSIEKAVFCTAYFPGDHGKRVRHEAFVKALAFVGVETRLGHTTTEPMSCVACERRWDAPREKKTDINLALAIMEDAFDNVFDVAFLVTADTDQASTVKMFKRRFPQKKIINVVPPGREPSKHLGNLCHSTIKLKAQQLDDCALPHAVTAEGQRTIYRPHEYDPPPGWVHPDDRPAR